MLVYEDNIMKKPIRLLQIMDMRVMKMSGRELRKSFVFKLVGSDEDEIVFAVDNE